MNLENFSGQSSIYQLLFCVKQHGDQYKRAHIFQILDNFNIKKND